MSTIDIINNINSADFTELDTALQMIRKTALIPGEQAGAELKIAIDKIYKDESTSTIFDSQSYAKGQHSVVDGCSSVAYGDFKTLNRKEE